MGNSTTSKVAGQDKVILKMISEKKLTLNNVLFVPKTQKNLASSSLLSKHDFCMIFETYMGTLSKVGMYVYVLESSILWQGRLGYVNYVSMRRLINLNHILAFHIDKNHKCETCVEAELSRFSFHSVERSTEPLRLIHTDVYDLKYIKHPMLISISLLSLIIVQNTVLYIC